MNVLVTGANGFIGKNLIAELGNRRDDRIYPYDLTDEDSLLEEYALDCDFVFHLAGVNRPREEKDYMEGNLGFTSLLLEKLRDNPKKPAILVTSSIQAELNNSYGRSKKAAEELLFQYGENNGNPILVYRLPNVFGKWCRPNYNSAVATFCHNIANGLDITVKDPSVLLRLVYIDDVLEEFIQALTKKENRQGQYCYVPVVHTVTLERIVEMLQSFKESRITLSVPDMSNGFEKKLYSTYLSYLPAEGLCYPLKMHRDHRGAFSEFMKSETGGQISVNSVKPGITKGNHWHHTKTEKFLVVRGKGLIRLRKINSEDVLEYHVTGDRLEAVDIPPGYTHSIQNEGEEELIMVIWANEAYHPEKPDTYPMEV